MRVPKSHLVTLKDGNITSVESLLNEQDERYFHDCMVDGIWGNSMFKRLDKGEYLFLTGNIAAKELGDIYRKRWSIERGGPCRTVSKFQRAGF